MTHLGPWRRVGAHKLSKQEEVGSSEVLLPVSFVHFDLIEKSWSNPGLEAGGSRAIALLDRPKLDTGQKHTFAAQIDFDTFHFGCISKLILSSSP